MSHAKQKQQILSYMRKHGVITTMISFKRLGITRLAARIPELEADGHLINHVPIHRNGKRYMGYSLVEAG